MTENFQYRLLGRDGGARLGEITMPRGNIRTPAFMPVGTAATVKAMYPEQVRALGADVVLGNTYHLMLRPGAERVAALGGLHKFMNWPYPILTDSGGFQVMSLSKLRKLDENGVTFQSHIDGAKHVLTPERSMEIQAPARRRHPDAVRRMREAALFDGGGGARHAPVAALGRTVAARLLASSRAAPVSASCRAGHRPTCASRAPRPWPAWASTAWRSAGSRSANHRTSCWR